ncbi:hypothetical protein Syun_010275 [Stephania yunnanensis]|uniref:Uncharacterized protein n=1 Tax=Stephania yunnanensis TaxID=152371 RepID=A0AAP0KG77_9MAGN
MVNSKSWPLRHYREIRSVDSESKTASWLFLSQSRLDLPPPAVRLTRHRYTAATFPLLPPQNSVRRCRSDQHRSPPPLLAQSTSPSSRDPARAAGPQRSPLQLSPRPQTPRTEVSRRGCRVPILNRSPRLPLLLRDLRLSATIHHCPPYPRMPSPDPRLFATVRRIHLPLPPAAPDPPDPAACR